MAAASAEGCGFGGTYFGISSDVISLKAPRLPSIRTLYPSGKLKLRPYFPKGIYRIPFPEGYISFVARRDSS